MKNRYYWIIILFFLSIFKTNAELVIPSSVTQTSSSNSISIAPTQTSLLLLAPNLRPVDKKKKKAKLKKKKRSKANKKHKKNKGPNHQTFEREQILYLILGILAILLALAALLLALKFPGSPMLLWSGCAFFFSWGILFLAVAVGFLGPFW